jgi:endonuclease/exonuclease/phosphatase family metal-dependent hydrolase
MTLRLPLWFGLLAIGGCCTELPAAIHGQNTPRDARTLEILTWNIWMMPRISRSSPSNSERAAVIAEELAKLNYDILCLEKVFDGCSQKILEAALGEIYPYRFGPANDGCSIESNSGVMVFSRIPLENYRELEFVDKTDVEILSKKGAVMVSGRVADHPFDLVATHLQGDDAPEYRPAHQEVRDRQLLQIADMVKQQGDPNATLFFCGDLSTPRDNPSYQRLVDMLELENGPESRITLEDDRTANDLAPDDTKRRAELDYVFVRPRSRITGRWTRHVIVHPGWDDSGRKNLAYRHAVGATFTFED